MSRTHTFIEVEKIRAQYDLIVHLICEIPPEVTPPQIHDAAIHLREELLRIKQQLNN